MKIPAKTLIAALLTTAVFAGPALAQSPAASPAPAAASSSGAEQLPPEKAKAFSEAMKAAAEANKELRPQVHKLYDELDAILTAEKFDKAAYMAKTAEIDQTYAKMREKQNEAFVSVAEKFSQSERKTLLEMRKAHRLVQ